MTYYARVQDDGQLILTADDARNIGLKPGDALRIDREGGKLVVRTHAEIVAEGQVRFQSMLPQGFRTSLADSLVADRRNEAARE